MGDKYYHGIYDCICRQCQTAFKGGNYATLCADCDSMPDQTMKPCREAFQKAMIAAGYNYGWAIGTHGKYESSHAQLAWTAWQAAKAEDAESVAELVAMLRKAEEALDAISIGNNSLMTGEGDSKWLKRVADFSKKELIPIRQALTTHTGNAVMGDASTRKDEVTGNAGFVTSPTSAQPACSEIPVVDENKLALVILDSIRDTSGGHSLTNWAGDRFWEASYPVNITRIVEAIRPYLRSPEPVMVNLEKGALAIETVRRPNPPGTMPHYIEEAKSCAEAWGLKWK